MTPHLPWRNDGVRRFAHEAGWNLIDTTRLVGGLAGLAGWRGDGAIVTLRDDPTTPAFVRRMRRAGIPVVDLSNQRPDIRVPRVCVDNVAIGRLAAAHFAEFNHRHAAWFSTHWMNVHAPSAGSCARASRRDAATTPAPSPAGLPRASAPHPSHSRSSATASRTPPAFWPNARPAASGSPRKSPSLRPATTRRCARRSPCRSRASPTRANGMDTRRPPCSRGSWTANRRLAPPC